MPMNRATLNVYARQLNVMMEVTDSLGKLHTFDCAQTEATVYDGGFLEVNTFVNGKNDPSEHRMFNGYASVRIYALQSAVSAPVEGITK